MTAHTEMPRSHGNSDLASYSASVSPVEGVSLTWEELWGENSTLASRSGDELASGTTKDDSEKTRIFVSRDYRYMNVPNVLFIVVAVVVLVLWAAFWILFYSPVSSTISTWVANIASQATGVAASVGGASYIPGRGQLCFVMMEGTLPSYSLVIGCIVASIIVMIFSLQSVKNTLPAGIYVCMGGFLVLVSALFFLFWADDFPYDLTTYSHLYMEQQVVLWIFVPIVGGLAVFMVDKRPVAALISFFIIVLVSVTYGIVRYVVFMVFLHLCSSIFMAALFFLVGALFDFMQMVAVYVIYVRNTSAYFGKFENRGKWQW